MGAFHIEDDWYLITDDYSWNLAKRVIRTRDGKPSVEYKSELFYETPKQALKDYIAIRQREAAAVAPNGELTDLISLLISETTRLTDILKEVYRQTENIELEKPSSE